MDCVQNFVNISYSFEDLPEGFLISSIWSRSHSQNLEVRVLGEVLDNFTVTGSRAVVAFVYDQQPEIMRTETIHSPIIPNARDKRLTVATTTGVRKISCRLAEMSAISI
jgi:hypothetical protein